MAINSTQYDIMQHQIMRPVCVQEIKVLRELSNTDFIGEYTTKSYKVYGVSRK